MGFWHRCGTTAFFSLSGVREAIAPLLAALNGHPFQKIEGSRRSLVEDLDCLALNPSPEVVREPVPVLEQVRAPTSGLDLVSDLVGS